MSPTYNHKILLNKHFGSVRWTYNYFLNQRKTEYLNNKKSLNYYGQAAELTQIKKVNEWLMEINSQTLQYSLKCLDMAYQGFFNMRTQFPRFKSKKSKNTFTIPQFVSIDGNKLMIPKFRDDGGIEMIMERKVKGTIKHCSITKTPTGKYHERTLKLNQQHLSRKTKGSARYEKQRLKVARIHEKITNSRMDLIHKTTLNLIREFDTIYLEDLNIKGMMKNHKLSKSISDVCWSKFIDILEYKSLLNDKSVVHIDRFFPSSKTCSKCGWINNSLTLNDREWTCHNCNTILDRDLNASINILNEGYRINNISVGTTDYGCGDQIRPDSSGVIYETLKEMELNDNVFQKPVPETTISLV